MESCCLSKIQKVGEVKLGGGGGATSRLIQPPLHSDPTPHQSLVSQSPLSRMKCSLREREGGNGYLQPRPQGFI